MEFTNPFQKDTEYYKTLINADAHPDEELAEYEEITDADTTEAVHKFMDSKTTKGFPASALEAIEEAKKRKEISKQNQKQVSDMFTKLFDDLNQKYGLDVKFDYNSLTNSMNYIIEPKNKRALELYLSEAYGRFRVALYTQYLQAIAMLSAQILNPEYILSDSMTYDAKLEVVSKLYTFMQTMNDIYEQVNVPDTDMKLEKISEDGINDAFNLNTPEIRDYMELLSKRYVGSNSVNSNDNNNETKE